MTQQKHYASALFYQERATEELIKLKAEWFTHFHNGITIHLDSIKSEVTRIEMVLEGLSDFNWYCGPQRIRAAKKVSALQQTELAKELAQLTLVQSTAGNDTSKFTAAWHYVMQPTVQTLSIMDDAEDELEADIK